MGGPSFVRTPVLKNLSLTHVTPRSAPFQLESRLMILLDAGETAEGGRIAVDLFEESSIDDR
jgi:hypothetical protein